MKRIAILFFAIFVQTLAFAHINPEREKQAQSGDQGISPRNDCAQATKQIDMSINNVRARLLNGGDVWWDLDDGKYIVPKVEPGSGVPEVSSLFAGAVWLGGYDDADNLKLAAQDFRSQTANDFWPGPLTPVGTTAKDTCLNWDRFFRVLGSNIRSHIRAFEEARESGIPMNCDAIPQDILAWPGKGNPYFRDYYPFDLPFNPQGLGAFWDEDGDELYDPCQGDYPVIEVRGCPEPNFPDEMIFWIYNDAGNIHTNTQGNAIRMEVQVQAFAYATNDEINDMTFQRYKLINRATSPIDSTFFAMWVDPDLGCSDDDFIGCDIERSLMYVYNEDALDGNSGCDCNIFGSSINTYCDKVPILGVDYFRGPRGPVNFVDTFPTDWVFDEKNNNTGINNGLDIILVDSTRFLTDTSKLVFGEYRGELGMSSFAYYMNGGIGNWPAAMTDPQAGAPQQFYRYMSGSWRDGTPISFGGSGYNIPPTQLIDYAFPDRPNNISGWSMCTADLDFGDRRTIQASGPFRLDPGEVNELIIGVPWVPDIDYPCPDISRLLSADDIAQALFDNCFILPDGPDAPDLDFIELDRELIVILSNDTVTSNNAFELYNERGLEIPPMEEDSLYFFEGYKVYQLSGPDVSLGELDDIEKARVVIQVDIKNGVNTLYNWVAIENPNPDNPFIWIPEVQVEGADNGIRHTFRILEDQFASEDRRLVNHKKYYYVAVAYAYNNFEEFDNLAATGQRRQYLEGRNNVKIYGPLPRPIVYKNLNSMYGEGPIVTRLAGEGVGENFLNVSDEVRESMLDPSFTGEIEYLPGEGPLKIQVYNPLDVKDGTFLVYFENVANSDGEIHPLAHWYLVDESEPDRTIRSEKTIARINEQIFGEYGFSATIGQSDDVGDRADETNGVIGGTLDYDDPSGPQWYLGIQDDVGGIPPLNFIKTNSPDSLDFALDPTRAFSNVGPGFFYPYHIGDYRNPQPASNPFGFMVTPTWLNNFSVTVRDRAEADLSRLNNVDIVFTKDKSKWSRCIIVETRNEFYSILGLTGSTSSNQMEVKGYPSVGKEDVDGDGVPDPDGEVDGSGNPVMGKGWFPGYAVDLETGKRLNIFFGENSVYREEFAATGIPPVGDDMMWNPTGDLIVPTGGANLTIFDFVLGGQHTIYVTDEAYDGCAALGNSLRPGSSNFVKIPALAKIKWTGIPLLNPETDLLSYQEGLIPNDAIVKLRVDNPYAKEPGLPEYNEIPTYRVEFRGIQADEVDEASEINTALDQINVVPNPYLGYSAYETSTFTNTVKITNLPANSTVSIYSIDGRFIRQYRRNEAGNILSPPRANPGIEVSQIIPDIEWDMKNTAGIPIASGVYLIHIDAPGLGERVIKWFGVNRKFDPSGL